MSFWNRRKKEPEAASEIQGSGSVNRKSMGRSRVFPLEVRLLAIDAREAGLSSREVGDLIGSCATTIDKWTRVYREEGLEGFSRQGANPGTRQFCNALRQKIEEYRKDNPEAGVRRIRDDLRRDECVAVSAEAVRKVVNDAGLGNPPPPSKRKPHEIRRFEREVPNAMWQIDIFTFELKRMYRVYLVGIIDDHSRYIVGHGLYRQQKAEAVLEVVRGAIGQWGSPREILSDNGRQFVAWRGKSEFQKVLRRQGVQHVRSAPQHPMTLGKIERFWKTLWTEFLSDEVFASFADARQRLDHWIGYYNHQRPHQGIDGACPADRFYGIAGDVEEALRQGCAENALQLALGQETRPPLYLLGKLGETDVRVTRKGDDIEIKLGDAVQEVIRMGRPYEVDSDGHYERRGTEDGLEIDDGRGAIPGGGDGAEGGGVDEGSMRNVWREPSDAEPGDGEGGACGAGGAGVETSWEEGEERGGEEDYGALEDAIVFGKGFEALEDEV